MVAHAQDDCPEALSCCFARPRGEGDSSSYLERLPNRPGDEDEELIGLRVTDPLLGSRRAGESQEATSSRPFARERNAASVPKVTPSGASLKFLERCTLPRPEALLESFVGDNFLPSEPSLASTREGFESPLGTLLTSPCSRTPSHALKSPKKVVATTPPVSRRSREVGHSLWTPPTSSTVATSTAYYNLQTPLNMGTVEAPLSSSAVSRRLPSSSLRDLSTGQLEVPAFEMMTPVSVRTESCITAEIDLTEKFLDISDDESEAGSFRLDVIKRTLDEDLCQDFRLPVGNQTWLPGEGL
mmetsp:Transcript_71006/g.148531  ORF Transcript_71006/g.148531 Transcript_71006/m.148531 type:complete len:299 (+) Transcript_71006:87-983(+)|eukprot:CAMPEP_0206473610 /NCGR_PEP_ID=MMETSP0324_2-20121206/32981_1 /ASSEMBLY_ACC=CAM_ASM_000836 /TAXON_ID=2866 /ORGANISM="Crypthecodinium cohnii, Strain Seligo" /LENGTH=298 /DNA_ID=CAMNT_0053948599 /DNA_START=49 /DNA_END=945 /DNA_ORIENTATION=+